MVGINYQILTFYFLKLIRIVDRHEYLDKCELYIRVPIKNNSSEFIITSLFQFYRIETSL